MVGISGTPFGFISWRLLLRSFGCRRFPTNMPPACGLRYKKTAPSGAQDQTQKTRTEKRKIRTGRVQVPNPTGLNTNRRRRALRVWNMESEV